MSIEAAKRAELAELAKAIGDRQLELKFGRATIYGVALADVKVLAERLQALVTECATVFENQKGPSR